MLLRFVREQSVRIDHTHVVTPQSWAGVDDRVLFTMPLVRSGSVAGPAQAQRREPAAALDRRPDRPDPPGAPPCTPRDRAPRHQARQPAARAHRHRAPAPAPDRLRHRRAQRRAAAHPRRDGHRHPGTCRPSSTPAPTRHPSADIYALGVVVLEMLTGQRPLVGAYGPVEVDALRTGWPEHDAILDVVAAATATDPPGGPSAEALRAHPALRRPAGPLGRPGARRPQRAGRARGDVPPRRPRRRPRHRRRPRRRRRRRWPSAPTCCPAPAGCRDYARQGAGGCHVLLGVGLVGLVVALLLLLVDSAPRPQAQHTVAGEARHADRGRAETRAPAGRSASHRPRRHPRPGCRRRPPRRCPGDEEGLVRGVAVDRRPVVRRRQHRALVVRSIARIPADRDGQLEGGPREAHALRRCRPERPPPPSSPPGHHGEAVLEPVAVMQRAPARHQVQARPRSRRHRHLVVGGVVGVRNTDRRGRSGEPHQQSAVDALDLGSLGAVACDELLAPADTDPPQLLGARRQRGGAVAAPSADGPAPAASANEVAPGRFPTLSPGAGTAKDTLLGRFRRRRRASTGASMILIATGSSDVLQQTPAPTPAERAALTPSKTSGGLPRCSSRRRHMPREVFARRSRWRYCRSHALQRLVLVEHADLHPERVGTVTTRRTGSHPDVHGAAAHPPLVGEVVVFFVADLPIVSAHSPGRAWSAGPASCCRDPPGTGSPPRSMAEGAAAPAYLSPGRARPGRSRQRAGRRGGSARGSLCKGRPRQTTAGNPGTGPTGSASRASCLQCHRGSGNPDDDEPRPGGATEEEFVELHSGLASLYRGDPADRRPRPRRGPGATALARTHARWGRLREPAAGPRAAAGPS